MRLLNRSLTLLAALVLFSNFHCDDCNLVDCDPGYLFVQFLSKADGSDLFTNGTYQRDSLQLFTLTSDMTATDYSHQLYNWQNAQYSELSFVLDRNAVGYIFQYNSQERDTLGIIFTMSEGSECCSETPIVTYGLFRSDTIFPDASGYLTLKK